MANDADFIEEEDDLEEEAELEGGEGNTLSDLPGVGAATREKLEAAGFTDMLGVAVASPSVLAEKVGMTPTVARKLIQSARAKLDMGFISGSDMLEKRKKVMKITVPSKELNKLLGGGFETGAIIEAFGQYGSSKTQIAHQLAVSVQQEGGKAVYIDTENTFRPERIISMAKALNIDTDQALKNFKVAKAYNSDHQMLLAEKVEELIKQDRDIRLVIVDSLTAHFRAEFIGRGTLAERQQKINRHMHTLSRIADTYNVCIFVTNQVMAKPDMFFGDPTEAIGGHIVGHNSTFRIYLRKGKKGSRVDKLVDSPNLPEAEAPFMITEDGVRDL